MSISVQGRVGWASIPNALGRSKLPHPTLHLLINLLTHSEGFNASYSLITQQTGMAPATIAKAIKNLEKLGLLTVGKAQGKSGQFASNHYTFHADLLWKLTPEFVDMRLREGKATTGNESGKNAATANEAGAATANEVAPLQEMKRKKEQEETPPKNDQPGVVPPPQKRTRHEYTPEFEEFWKMWPNQRGQSKFEVSKKFARALKAADAETILEGARRFAADPNLSVDYCPAPTTWLNNRRWEAGPLPSRNSSPSQQGSRNSLSDWLPPMPSNAPELDYNPDLLAANVIDHQEGF